MKKNVNFVEFSDLLWYAEKNNIGWNRAHKFLVDNDVPPMNELKYSDYNLSTLEANRDHGDGDYNWSKESFDLVIGFMKENNMRDMILV